MSLDISLRIDKPILKIGTGVFIRENGQNRELTIAEVKEKFPDTDIEFSITRETEEVFDTNITHNLIPMAKAVDLYYYISSPSGMGIKKAKDLIEPLKVVLDKLRSDPEKYKQYNPSNGWGDYEGFVNFLISYLSACYMYPEAEVEVDAWG
jgi:hypothetical protein